MKIELRQATLQSLFWSGIGQWGYRVLNLVLFVVLSRLLTPEDFGLVALSMVYIAFLQIFLEQGFSEALIQRWELSDEVLSSAFWINLGIGIFLCGATFFAAPLTGWLFQEQLLIPVVRWLSFLFVSIGAVSVPMALLRREMKFRSLAVASIVGVLIGGAAGITVALSGSGVWALVTYQLTNKFCEMVVIWFNSDWRPRFQFSVFILYELLDFGWKVTGSRLLNFINRYGADFVIGFFLGPVSVGYYNLAFRLTRTFVGLIGSVVSVVTFSAFSKLQFDPVAGRNLFYQAIQQLSLLSIPVFAGMAVLSEEIIQVTFGPTWLQSAPLMQVLALIGILHSLYYINSSVLLGYGKPNWRLLLDGVNALTNFLGFLIAAQWSILAVACVYVIRGYVLAPLPFLAIRHLLHLSLSEYLRRVAPAFIGSAAMVIVIHVLRSLLRTHLEAAALLACCIMIGALTYLIAILLLAPESIYRTWRYARIAVTPNRTIS